MTDLRATYRLQLREEFGLRDATALVPYLAKLGMSHVYLSPCMQATKGSTHGYDVVDPTRVSDDLGGQEAFDELVAALRAHSMGLVVDVVPNHMAIAGRANKWWWDVLRHGRKSEFARFFDIDWSVSNSILLPVLGDHYGRVLERGELKLAFGQDEIVLHYHDQDFPIDPITIDAKPDIAAINDDVDRLDFLIGVQNYRLAYWRVARDELDYRRFFDIDSLVALRNEDPEVLDATHSLVFEWLADGTVDGLRIDHVDGLRDPLGYLRRVREKAPSVWLGVEKILELGETLPAMWPVQGTTGYDSARVVDGLFIEPASEKAFSEIYRDVCEQPDGWSEVVRGAKRYVVENVLGSDVARVTQLLGDVCNERRRFRDFTRKELRTAIEGLLVSMPVYRTYIVAENSQVTSADTAVVIGALHMAREMSPGIDSELFDLLALLFSLELTGDAEGEFVMKFQQLSGPVSAKGVEDTAFYRYSHFVALDEVGNDPSHWATRPDDFHEHAAQTQRQWPLTLNAGSTHDSKRSADVRARLAVLSEVPSAWAAAVRRWMSINAVHRRGEWPDPVTEYFIYQTMIGAFPLSEERAVAHVMKAVREAKLHTSWTDPNDEYEHAVEQFLRGACGSRAFNDDLDEFMQSIVTLGRINSLSAIVLRFTMPGVPDTYQGDELWNYALVDPDNRNAVDFELRKNLDQRVVLPEGDDVGASKLFVTAQCARLRSRHPQSFGSFGDYKPIASAGAKAAHVVAFGRGEDIVTIAPRLVKGLSGDWADTAIEIPSGDWRNIFTDERVTSGSLAMSALFQRFQVAVLEKIDV